MVLSLSISSRASHLDPPYIEDVLVKYADVPDTSNLAMGVSHWDPPPNALRMAESLRTKRSIHGYGPIVGTNELQDALRLKLKDENGLDLMNQEVMVTAGANQAFSSIALALCDPGDEAIILAPYYFSHVLALQTAQARVKACRWDPLTMLPDLKHLDELLFQSGSSEGGHERSGSSSTTSSTTRDGKKVQMVVLTNPGNPTGAVCPEPLLRKIVDLCKRAGVWLVVDQTYEHFLHEGATHFTPCAESLGYQGIIHIFSMSKSFGLAGWRLGYVVYPRNLMHQAMRSIQDTIPTHASMATQVVGLGALDVNQGQGGSQWTKEQVARLKAYRERMWQVLEKYTPETVKTKGAFYFLARLPSGIQEEEAVHVLAFQYKVLCTPGRAFGAPGHLRLSYGSLPEKECKKAIDRLEAGLRALTNGS